MLDECRRIRQTLQRRAVNNDEISEVPPIVHEVLHSPGQPLDTATRAFTEPRFGHDFSRVRTHTNTMPYIPACLTIGAPHDDFEQEADMMAHQVMNQSVTPNDTRHDFSGVRIHTDNRAAASARAVNAYAYTVGGHIIFDTGKYAPNSSSGQRLLAHELTHVLQQTGGRSFDVVQRAEVDDRSCAGLTDIESDIDAKVNGEIAAARAAAGSPPEVFTVLLKVARQLGGVLPVSPLETLVEGLPATKRKLPPSSLAGTKYAGVEAVNQFYRLHTLGLEHVVGSAAKVHGICIGADKLGHFFQQGADYFDIMSAAGGTTATAESAGRAMEIGIQGLGSTGVYSRADQAANLAGAQFYKDLKADISGFKFNIRNYITSQWNEQANPSFYASDVGGVVWRNLLTGSWQGGFTSEQFQQSSVAKVILSATPAGVTGTYEQMGARPTKKGNIKNGVITQKTTSVSGTIPGESSVSASPVSGISIQFDWEEIDQEGRISSGKGNWDSVDEQTLVGTWGTGVSRTGGGSWNLTKV